MSADCGCRHTFIKTSGHKDRIIFQSWNRAEALAGMTGGGYGHHSMWTNLPKHIRGVDLNQIRAVLGCPPSGSCAAEPEAGVQ